ncbi:MAG TPA: PRC-barrel domain-containing protein [Thermoanaerobaculia bacterium]|nr:PRC-barrel domain-containing protein [Thermoanaerobaculia bacterium]
MQKTYPGGPLFRPERLLHRTDGKEVTMKGSQVAEKPRVLSASTLSGDPVRNTRGEDLGKIEDFMIDLDTGRIGYAVLSFGGVFGIGDKLFAVPWKAMSVDTDRHCFLLDVPKERLKNAPGFDKDNWPDITSTEWNTQINSFYGTKPYWEERL